MSETNDNAAATLTDLQLEAVTPHDSIPDWTMTQIRAGTMRSLVAEVRRLRTLTPFDAAAVAKGIAGMTGQDLATLMGAMDGLFRASWADVRKRLENQIADILRPILPTPGAGTGTGTAMPKHIVTADGVSVAVGTVLYNHEGVAREHWIERRGEWRVETRWQHFTHGNRAAELYSTAEAAKQDWRNRSPGAGTGGEGAAPTQPPADDAHVAPGSRLFSNPNLIKPATPEQQELRAAREEIETLKQDVEKYRSDAMNCCNKLGQAMELAGERTKLTRWLAQGIASSGEQETVNRKIRRIEEEVFRLLSPAPKGEVRP